MNESATHESAPGTRERRRLETSRSLVSLARRATGEHGLSGFTIEQLCEQAGVSRRTFFNYFASKEDAVLGFSLHDDSTDLDEFFVQMRPRTAPDALSANLLGDYARLLGARWAALDVDHASANELMAAVEREPRLITHMLERHRREERADAALIARREGLTADDPRVVAAVQIVGHLARLAVPASLDPEHPRAFADVLDEYLSAAHALFSTQLAPDPDGSHE